MDIERLFSDRALENDRYSSVVIKPTARVFEELEAYIERFPDLVNVDYVSEEFLDYLAGLIGFTYLSTEDADIQREQIKRYLREYKKKGSIEQIVKTAARGYSENYLLGDLTYYKGAFDDDYAYIVFTRDKMFRHDYSTWDNYRWGDPKRYGFGIMNIYVAHMTNRTVELLDKVIPGGIRYTVTELRDSDRDRSATGMTDRNAMLIGFSANYELKEILEAYETGPERSKDLGLKHYDLDESRWDGGYDEDCFEITSIA